MKIAVVGIGYVGLSIACLLARSHEVYALDIIEEKVALINEGKSPISDTEIEEALRSRALNLVATIDPQLAYQNADFIVVATPTDYDDHDDSFDTSSVESVLEEVSKFYPCATVVIKSTIPVGYTQAATTQFPSLNLLFSPEFLREGQALYDNLHPSRIVIGIPAHEELLETKAREFAELLLEGAANEEVSRVNDDGSIGIPVLITGSTEAEAIKLFANTYLALRVSYFNELDTFAAKHGLDAVQIIKGVSLDPRIGSHYNNPSFGYGGYCLPKDTKQLLSNYRDVPQNIIKAIVDANQTRKNFVASQVEEMNPQTVGIFRLVMKEGSDNFRQSSICDIMRIIKEKGIKIVIFEPLLDDVDFEGNELIRDLTLFKERSDVILSNRLSNELDDVIDKVYSRDIWHKD